MLSRRFFLKSTALTAAGALLLRNNAFAFAPAKLKFGFISGIIGKELEGDWKEVLKKTVDYGFSEIELGKYMGESASEFMSYCKKIGIRPVAGFVPFTDKKDEIEKSLDNLAQLEIKYPVTYWPWNGSGPFTLEDCKKSAGILNKMGEICKSHSMEFCWHNHNKEFIAMEEGFPFDYLMEHTEKDLVKCEMDVYWVTKGGADPLTFLKKYSGRYRILHLKDMTADETHTFECVGSGIIDFPSILREAQGQGIEHFMLEYDNVVDGMACLKTSGEYLRNLKI
jgi:sugar phosphate isomerase/epimerase